MNLINNDILDELILHEFICLIINQKTYFALYIYLFLKSEITLMKHTNLKQTVLTYYRFLKEKNYKHFY